MQFPAASCAYPSMNTPQTSTKRRPRLTDRVLIGIRAACGQALAGEWDGELEKDMDNIEAAWRWVVAMDDTRDTARAKRKATKKGNHE